MNIPALIKFTNLNRPGRHSFTAFDSRARLFQHLADPLTVDQHRAVLTAPIDYVINTYGYRTGEFQHTDWSNSIVVFGDSFVFGEGINQADSFVDLIGTALGIPTVNLGIAGCSNQLALLNSLALLADGLVPKAVILYVTGTARHLQIENDKPYNYGPWREGDYFYKKWLTGGNGEVYGAAAARAVGAIWSTRCPTVVCQSHPWIDHDDHVFALAQPVDLARDLAHAGAATHRIWAESLADQLAAKGLVE